MGEIVNLRRARKRIARVEAAQAAAENRVRHGRTADQKRADGAAEARAQAAHRNQRLDGTPDETPSDGDR